MKIKRIEQIPKIQPEFPPKDQGESGLKKAEKQPDAQISADTVDISDEARELLKKPEGAVVSPDRHNRNAQIVSFNFEQNTVVTIRLLFHDKTGSGVVITNMTALPEGQKGKGFGSRAVQSILEWARNNNLNEVRATQVEPENEKFWVKNGFIKDEKPNPSNDFVYPIFP
jgi:GNAT superfamily N-acetyltransferase